MKTNLLPSRLFPAVLQKTAFYLAKGGLLAAKRRPFGMRKTVYWTPTPALPKGGGLIACCHGVSI